MNYQETLNMLETERAVTIEQNISEPYRATYAIARIIQEPNKITVVSDCGSEFTFKFFGEYSLGVSATIKRNPFLSLPESSVPKFWPCTLPQSSS